MGKNIRDNLTGLKVLVVEDDEINQMVAAEVLKAEGIFVSLADNGELAVDMIAASAERQPYDAVLMDLQMPVMDGFSATKEIRKDDRFADLPILAMTADTMSGVRDKVLDVGMNDYVAKPIDPAALFRTLAKWARPEDRNQPLGQRETDTGIPIADEGLAFDNLEGINAADGLSRVGGKPAVYRKLLKKFSDDHAHVVEDITRALAEGDMERVERTVHTLKGVSGNVGATDLHKAAAVLDDALRKENTDGLDAILGQVGAALHIMLGSIQRVVSQEEKAQPAVQGAVDTEKITGLMETLKDLLKDYDGSAADVLDRLQEHLTGIEAVPTIEKLALQIGNFDYGDALETLDELAQVLIAERR